MSHENKIKQAKQMFDIFCSFLDEQQDFQYEKKSEELLIHFGVMGNEIPIEFFIQVDADLQIVRLTVPLHYKIKKHKTVECALATLNANYVIGDGCFVCNLFDDTIQFRMTESFVNCSIGPADAEYMIYHTVQVLEHYGKKLSDLNDGTISIEDFDK